MRTLLTLCSPYVIAIPSVVCLSVTLLHPNRTGLNISSFLHHAVGTATLMPKITTIAGPTTLP